MKLLSLFFPSQITLLLLLLPYAHKFPETEMEES